MLTNGPAQENWHLIGNTWISCKWSPILKSKIYSKYVFFCGNVFKQSKKATSYFYNCNSPKNLKTGLTRTDQNECLQICVWAVCCELWADLNTDFESQPVSTFNPAPNVKQTIFEVWITCNDSIFMATNPYLDRICRHRSLFKTLQSPKWISTKGVNRYLRSWQNQVAA